MIKPVRVELGEGITKFDGFFRLYEYPVSYERFDATMSVAQNMLVFERGDSVAALVYDTVEDEVLLTNQFRLPVHLRKRAAGDAGKGWISELPAGMIRKGEQARETMARELAEEIGVNVQIEDIEELFRFFVSPGGTTEQITLYFIKVRRVVPQGGGGLPSENENIHTERLPVEQLFSLVEGGQIEDAKTLIAALWLKQYLARTPAGPRKGGEAVSFPAFKGDTRTLGYKTGDIMETGQTDAWVSSENTDMLMDRFAGKSVSAAIRWHGALKDPDSPSRIKDDLIQDALRQKMDGRKYVAPGFVIETSPGQIELTKGIFHVASVQGSFGQGFGTTLETIDLCIDNVFKKIEASRSPRYTSVLIPLLGTGQAGLHAKDVVPRLVARARHFFRAKPKSKLREIYFLAYTRQDRELLERELRNVPDPA